MFVSQYAAFQRPHQSTCRRHNDAEQYLSRGVQALRVTGLASIAGPQIHIAARSPSYCHTNYTSGRDVLLPCSLRVLGGGGVRGQAVTALSLRNRLQQLSLPGSIPSPSPLSKGQSIAGTHSIILIIALGKHNLHLMLPWSIMVQRSSDSVHRCR